MPNEVLCRIRAELKKQNFTAALQQLAWMRECVITILDSKEYKNTLDEERKARKTDNQPVQAGVLVKNDDSNITEHQGLNDKAIILGVVTGSMVITDSAPAYKDHFSCVESLTWSHLLNELKTEFEKRARISDANQPSEQRRFFKNNQPLRANASELETTLALHQAFVILYDFAIIYEWSEKIISQIDQEDISALSVSAAEKLMSQFRCALELISMYISELKVPIRVLLTTPYCKQALSKNISYESEGKKSFITVNASDYLRKLDDACDKISKQCQSRALVKTITHSPSIFDLILKLLQRFAQKLGIAPKPQPKPLPLRTYNTDSENRDVLMAYLLEITEKIDESNTFTQTIQLEQCNYFLRLISSIESIHNAGQSISTVCTSIIQQINFSRGGALATEIIHHFRQGHFARGQFELEKIMANLDINEGDDFQQHVLHLVLHYIDRVLDPKSLTEKRHATANEPSAEHEEMEFSSFIPNTTDFRICESLTAGSQDRKICEKILETYASIYNESGTLPWYLNHLRDHNAVQL